MPSIQSRALQLLGNGHFKVGVVGLGYVGLPLAVAFAKRCRVIGFDTDQEHIKALTRGESACVNKPQLEEPQHSGTLALTHQPKLLAGCDAIIICVPTPLGKHHEPDLSHVRAACETIAPMLRHGTLVVLESTTYPGTTEDVVAPILNRGVRVPGKDYFLAYSPERENPGGRLRNVEIPKIVGGCTTQCLDIATTLYRLAFDRVVSVSSVKVAETSKLLENVFRCVNIALVNELKILAQKMDIDIWQVIDAASTKPFGFMPFYPGPGLGGHCIPIDPFYLTWKAREYGMSTRFIELAGEINAAMPQYVMSRITEGLEDIGLPVRGNTVVLVGVAYKAGVSDIRESPAIAMVRLLRQRGARISYVDPNVPSFEVDGAAVPRRRPDSRCACAVVLTDHGPEVTRRGTAHARVVVDTRNAMPRAVEIGEPDYGQRVVSA